MGIAPETPGRRRSRLRIIVAVLLVGVAIVLADAVTGQVGIFSFFLPSGPSLEIASPNCGTWEIKGDPLPGLGVDVELSLSDMASSPSGDIWAVGSVTDRFGDGYHPAMARWEGNHWRMIGLPDVQKEKAYLSSVDFISENDGWAVGHALEVGPDVIAMRWNGWTWSLSPMPSVLGALYAVHGISGDNVWAVGWQNHAQPMQEYPLLMHWDGATWRTVTLPIERVNGTLYDVLALSKDDVWVVGSYNEPASVEPLVLHWDGSSWQTVPAPLQCSGGHALLSLSATDVDDIWAVGSCDYGNPTLRQKMVQHWDGTRWTIRKYADQEEISHVLRDVVALSSKDVWAVGAGVPGDLTTSVLHWDGSTWQSVPGPPVDEYPNSGDEIVPVSSNELWLLGHGISGSRPYVARFLRCP